MAKILTRSRSKAKITNTKSRGGKRAKVSSAKRKSRGGRMTASGVIRMASNQGAVGINQSTGEDAADYLMAIQARGRDKGAHLSMAAVHARIS